MPPIPDRLSTVLQGILNQEENQSITLGGFFDRMKDKGLEIMIVMISLPFCQPVPLLGLSTPFGFLLIALGFRLSMRWGGWAPNNLKSRPLPQGFLSMMRRYALPLAIWMEKWIRPRILFLSSSNAIWRIHGINIILLALLLAMPLPIPFSNVIASWPIVILSIGLMERDGLVILIAYALSLAAYAFFIILFYLGAISIKRAVGM